jgi:hypothetical protein
MTKIEALLQNGKMYSHNGRNSCNKRDKQKTNKKQKG